MHLHLWISCAVSVAAMTVEAGPNLTLEQAVQKAELSNPGFGVLKADVEAAEAEKLSANARPNPTLTWGSGIKHTKGAGSETGFHGEFGLEQTFEFPGKRSLRVWLAEGDIRLRKLAQEGLAREIRIEVRRAFFAALAADQMASLRVEQIQSAQTFLLAARKRVESGYASDFEAMKAQADWIAAHKAFGDATSGLRQAKWRLSALMGTLPDTNFTLVGQLDTALFAMPAGDALAMALAQNSAIKTRELQVELSQNFIRAAELSAKPDFSLAPSLEYTQDEQIYGLNVSLPLPLWNKGKGEIRKAKSESDAAQAELKKAKQEITLAVQTAQEKVRLAQEQLALYTPQFLEGLKNIMLRAEKVYGQNSTTLLIYLESRRSYFESLSDYYEALAACAESQLDLEAAMGIALAPITDKNGVK